MVVALLMGARKCINDLVPDDREPTIQNALLEMSFALYEDREPEFDYVTSVYLAGFYEDMEKYAEAT